MKVALFLFSFCCIFAVTDAIECWDNKKGDTPKLKSDCKGCTFYNVTVQCAEYTPGIERLCLKETLIGYEKIVDQCFNNIKDECEESFILCTTDKCNMNCGLSKIIPPLSSTSTSTSSSPSTTVTSTKSTTTPTQQPSSIPSTTTTTSVTATRTEVKNGGISLTVSFYLFGFFALIYSLMI